MRAINPNFVLHEVANGLMALDMVKRELRKQCRCPDKGYKLILMDVQMPIMNGIEASQKILRLRPINIVAVTSYTSQANKDECINAGIKAVY